jgi:hypothetical protein
MRLTIVPSDNIVSVDGQPLEVDCSPFPQLAGIHAVQWNGTKGHQEYVQEDESDFRPNTLLTSIDAYADVIAAWEDKLAEVEAAEQEAQQRMQAMQPSLRKE